jgi:hypothetical protein
MIELSLIHDLAFIYTGTHLSANDAMCHLIELCILQNLTNGFFKGSPGRFHIRPVHVDS